MIRIPFILTLVVAMLLGSLGMPLTLHSCQMAGMERQMAASCGMCGHESSHSDMIGERIDDPSSCCVNEHVVHQLPPTVQSQTIELSAPMVVLLHHLMASLHLLRQDVPSAAFSLEHCPPAFAERGRTTYLRNSSFLI